MSEPQRMIDEGGDEISRSLLRSAREDAPSPHARQKAMIALGLAGTVSATVTAATSTGAASTIAKSGATVAMLKWIGLGVVSGVITVGAASFTPKASTGPAPEGAVTTAAKVATAPVKAAAAPGQAAAVEPAEAPSAEPKVTAPAPTAEPVAAAEPAKIVEAPRPSAKPAERPSLADEVAALDAARVALSSGDASGALRALDDHDRRFPGGALGQEATMLRISALAQRGDRAAAQRLGRAFIDAHPNSPLAVRVRALIGEDTPSP